MIISKLKSFRELFFRTTREELSQAVARLVFTIVITISFYYFYGISNSNEVIYNTRMLLNLFLFYAILHWLHVSIYKKEYLIRKLIAIIFDISGVSLILSFSGAEGSILFPIYFWIVLGNGIRFGFKYLFFSMFFALVGFQFVLHTNPFWMKLPYLGNGLSLAIVILPLFYFYIMHRLQTKNNLLLEKLKSSTYVTLHDTLTLLPNRAFLLVQMEDYATKGDPYFLIFIDIDDFKNINDLYGEKTGDEILIEVVSRITSVMQYYKGFVARLGGDEFAIISEVEYEDEVKVLATELLEEISMPYRGYHCKVSASIGITYVDHSNKKEIEVILKETDRAMQAVKLKGKNGFKFYQGLD